jgi:Leucine-rich repeat (LRR) protein
MKNLVNLGDLNCSSNQLTSLEEIQNLVNLEILSCYDNQLTSLERIENLVNLQKLFCGSNQLKSLEGIENLVNLKDLNCCYNKLVLLEGIENLVNLIKNNKKIIKGLYYNFADFGDYIELNDLFVNLIKCKNDDKINEYIEKIEQMIIKLNGFSKYVLK